MARGCCKAVCLGKQAALRITAAFLRLRKKSGLRGDKVGKDRLRRDKLKRTAVMAGILVLLAQVRAGAEEPAYRGRMLPERLLEEKIFASYMKGPASGEYFLWERRMTGRDGSPAGMEGFLFFAEAMKPEGMQGAERSDQSGEETPSDEAAKQELRADGETVQEITDIIFVGDSRVVGMASAGGYHYVGEVSMGYSWLTGEGTGWMLQEMAANPDAAIVLCFGINDLGNIGSYIGYYQTLISQYPDREWYFMSVNPVNEAAASACGYTVNNAMIEAFNQSLMSSFPDRYIDVYSYLLANGFGTGDGIHYDAGTYGTIQDYTLLMINAMRNFNF